ncbi:hypothetical protein J437_LFUL008325 [Ladona fulva]|uniref:Integrase catalytic domain-containing protein n=1 Tax=Ladona fulva TaxID=123851 RepID=A0A8K0P2M8_LADFU|nr:hypothetical protein J437_LFUL008325 [Ladona fulva]
MTKNDIKKPCKIKRGVLVGSTFMNGTGTPPGWVRNTNNYRTILRKGKLVSKLEPVERQRGRSGGCKTSLPKNLRAHLLREAHDGIFGGLLGMNRTLDKVRERLESGRQKLMSQNARPMLLAPLRKYSVGSTFVRIALDIPGPIPKTNNGQQAVTVAEISLRNWISRFGVPMELHTDQGRNFSSALFQEHCKLSIHKTSTAALRTSPVIENHREDEPDIC